MKRYPIPCPGCRRIIDARDHLCPQCGVDTDAKLAPIGMALPAMIVGILLGAGALAGGSEATWIWMIGLGVGLVVALAMVLYRRRGRR